MGKKAADSKPPAQDEQPLWMPERASHGRIVAVPDKTRYLDPVQLTRLEESFRSWSASSPRFDVRLSRQRILLIFLLIRYTGAKLHEVLALQPYQDIDPVRHAVVFGKTGGGPERSPREVQIPEMLAQELQAILADSAGQEACGGALNVDPGHVRRKFYERAAACGFPKELGGPDALRKARAVELMQNNVPLPVVQKILGHSTPNLTAAFVSYTDDDIRQVSKFFLDKEAQRRTSARNTFFGKINRINKGDIQAKVELVTLGGDIVTTVITNNSLIRLGLKVGTLITAEVKAPWVVLQGGEGEPRCTADNRFRGKMARISRGKVTTEYVVQIADGTELCSLVSTKRSRQLDLKENDPVWALFNCFAVVLHID